MTNKNLILTRKQGNKIIIHDGDNVLCTLTVVALGSGQCKLGFQADANIRIDREEIYKTKLLEEE